MHAMFSELRAAGIPAEGFGSFSRSGPVDFDHAHAVPILLRWFPTITDGQVRESIARSLTDEPEAREPGAVRVLVGEFMRRSDDSTTRWAIGNALATLADGSVADDLILLLRDRSFGTAREMLCEALKRTGDARAPAVLIEVIDDDDVAGHAVSVLRSFGPKTALVLLSEAEPKLKALLERSTATPFAQTQAGKALAEVAATRG
jgi:HEAT repeat protein